MPPVVQSVFVGLPRWLGVPGSADPFDKPWSSGFLKDPVAGPVRVTATNLAGDGQADLLNHGGIDKAVLAYSADHYPAWAADLGAPGLPAGAFGENLAVAGLSEETVCIGDTYRVGTAVFEVSQPRQPCWKLARRCRLKDLPARVVQSGRCGWYLRVLQEGDLQAGDACERLTHPNPAWTVLRAHRVMHFAKRDAAESAALAAVPGLSANWREGLLGRLV